MNGEDLFAVLKNNEPIDQDNDNSRDDDHKNAVVNKVEAPIDNEIDIIYSKKSFDNLIEELSDDDDVIQETFCHVEGSLKRKRIPVFVSSVRSKKFKSGNCGVSNIYQRIEQLILSLKSDNMRKQLDAANEIRILAQIDYNRVVIAEKHGIQQLINLLKVTNSIGVQRHVAGALWNLGVNVKNNKLISDLGAISPLISLLESEAEKVQRVAAGAIRCLAWKHEENRVKIATSGGIKPLVKLLKSSNQGIQEQAAAALWNLGLNPSNSLVITNSGAIECMIDLMKTDN